VVSDAALVVWLGLGGGAPGDSGPKDLDRT
jgi:hypothetical protein